LSYTTLFRSAHLLLIRMALLFCQSNFPVQDYEFLNANNTPVDLDRMWYLQCV